MFDVSVFGARERMIPFVDLQAQYRSIEAEVNEAVLGVFASTQFVLGSEVAAFESLFADHVSVERGVGVNSGTSALHLAMLAAGLGPGDEVITTPMTFIATVSAIDYAGATPVFVDIDPVTLNIDPSLIEAKITPRTKAIVPVHLHGLPADLDPILEIADRHGLIVIEDAAQAHGAEYKGRRVGSIGKIGCFSFYPGKNLGAYGEGGAVTTNDPDVIRTVSMLRDWGSEVRYHHDLKGFNYRMEGVQGAVLRVKMAYIEQWTESRRRLAARYDELLGELGYRTPAAPPIAVTSTTCTRSARPIATNCRAFCRNAALRRGSTTRFRCTCRRRSPNSATLVVTSRWQKQPPTRCCRSRCTLR